MHSFIPAHPNNLLVPGAELQEQQHKGVTPNQDVMLKVIKSLYK